MITTFIILNFLFTLGGILFFISAMNTATDYNQDRYHRMRQGLSDALMQLNELKLKAKSHNNRIKQLVDRHQRLRQANAQLHRDFGRALYQKGIKKGKQDAKKEKARR